MRTIKTYSKGAPFYNVLTRHWAHWPMISLVINILVLVVGVSSRAPEVTKPIHEDQPWARDCLLVS
jgi:hypothetical protein